MTLRHNAGPAFPQPARSFGGTKEDAGGAFAVRDLNKFIKAGGLEWGLLDPRPTKEASRREGDFNLSDVDDAYEKATAVIATAHDGYTKAVRDFKTEIKNDLASISASANKVQAEAQKAAAANRQAIEVMTSERMLMALANAERLATALHSINSLEPNSLTFAVFGKKPPE